MGQKNWIVFIGLLLLSFLFSQTVFANEKPVDNSIVDLVKFNDVEINDTMNVIQDEAIFKMNEYREKLGLPLFNKNTLIQKASQSHANYLFINNEMGHSQNKDKPGFTGVSSWNRAAYFGYDDHNYSEGITFGAPTGIEGINVLVDAPYHRIPNINPQFTDVGTGYNKRGDIVVNYGNAESPQLSREHEVVMYPYQNQKDVKTSWMALELPNPLRFWGVNNGDYKIVGYPISFSYFGKDRYYFDDEELVVEKITLTDESGKPIPTYDVTPELEPESSDLFIIPKKELDNGMTYDVSVDAHMLDDGKKIDISRKWSFTTMEEINVTDIYFIRNDKNYPNEFVVEINNGANVDYEFRLEKDGKEYYSSDDMFNQTIKYPIVAGHFTLKVTIPKLKKEVILPVTIQKNKEQFYTAAGDWRVIFDRQGKDTEVISWLFQDVKPGMSHYDAMKFIVKNNIASGSNDKFRPWDSTYRGQMAKMITNALDLPLPSNVKKSLAVYADVNEKSDYAEYIAAVTDAGIFKGNAIKGSEKRKFGTYSYINREQMATVLVRAFALQEKNAGGNQPIYLKNVSETHRDAVQILANLKITTELNDYRPAEKISRAALSTLLYRVMKE